jgi:hypothetical protein
MIENISRSCDVTRTTNTCRAQATFLHSFLHSLTFHFVARLTGSWVGVGWWDWGVVGDRFGGTR